MFKRKEKNKAMKIKQPKVDIVGEKGIQYNILHSVKKNSEFPK